MKRNFVISLWIGFWMTGCAIFSGDNGQLAAIQKFTPSLLKDIQVEAVHEFKVRVDGNRETEGQTIQWFLPHCLDRHTLVINFKKLHYRLEREQLEKMLGQPASIQAGVAVAGTKAGWGTGNFTLLEYKLSAGTSLHMGNSLFITLYKGCVVDSNIPGVIVY